MTEVAAAAVTPPEPDGVLAVAVAQFRPGVDAAQNLNAMRTLAATAAGRGAHVVVFPEYSQYFEAELGPAFLAAAQPLSGSFVLGLAELARDLDVHIVAGMVESTADGDRFSNTLVAVHPNGQIVATYRKQHLYDAFGARESRWVLPGALAAPQTFVVQGLRLGLQTCYDIRFPELSRVLVDAGVDVMLVPAEWVRGPLKEQHWRTLLTARALENTVYLAAADHAPPVGVGNSMIVDPMGVELVTIGETTDVAVAWLSAARLAEVRALNPALVRRRYDVVART